LGVPGRADTVEELSELVRSRGVEPLRWYGVWLFVDWFEFSGAELEPSDSKQVAATAPQSNSKPADETLTANSVASFHLVGRKIQADGESAARC
jgi:S-adenosylmethionine-dependent methyltransferase